MKKSPRKTSRKTRRGAGQSTAGRQAQTGTGRRTPRSAAPSGRRTAQARRTKVAKNARAA